MSLDSRYGGSGRHCLHPDGRGVPQLASPPACPVSPGVLPDSLRGIHPPASYLATTPLSPREISISTLARIRGRTIPAGDARYLGSHTGSNFSLKCLTPWKL